VASFDEQKQICGYLGVALVALIEVRLELTTLQVPVESWLPRSLALNGSSGMQHSASAATTCPRLHFFPLLPQRQ